MIAATTCAGAFAQQADAPKTSPPAAALDTLVISEAGSAEVTTPQSTQASIADLQRQIKELSEKVDAAPMLERTPQLGGTGSTMKVFGRLHTDAWTFSTSDDAINVFESGDPAVDPRNRLGFRRARIGVSGKIKEDASYKVEIDFASPEGFAFKDMTYGFENLIGGQKLLVGNQKRPYGLDHLNSSASTCSSNARS